MIPKVTIIIPVYKTAEFLRKCLDSCINQTYQDIEIIIVIDGSPDDSYDIAKTYQERDNRIQIINKVNEGLPKTRRVGFDASTGDYILHLDSDDYIENNTISVLLTAMLQEDAGMVIGGTIYEDYKGQKTTTWISKISGNHKTDYLNDIFSSNLQPNIWGRLIKREIFQPVFVPSQYSCGEDYLANIMMICYNPGIKITIEPSLLFHYVVNKDSLTNTWPAEAFMPYTEKIAEILNEFNLESLVLEDWAYFRVIKSWRYYLRRGGKEYLKDKKFVEKFYQKYFQVVKNRLRIIERIELNLYTFNQPVGWIFSRFYLKFLKITGQNTN